MSRKLSWASLPEDKLLQLRLKDLKVRIEGTWLEYCVRDLYDELEQRGLRIRPHTWIADEWFSPIDTPGIAIPFYLAHPRLKTLEMHLMMEIEGGTPDWCRCSSPPALRRRSSPARPPMRRGRNGRRCC